MAKRLSRRRLLETLAGLPFMSGLASGASAAAQSKMRVRPGDPAWPSEASWDQLSREVEGRLIKVRSPLADCVSGSFDANCEQTFKELEESLLSRGRGRAHPVARLGRGVDVGAKRQCGRRQDN